MTLPLKVYVASSWDERAYARDVVEILTESGLFEVTSSWMFTNDAKETNHTKWKILPPEVLRREAERDLKEIDKSDALLMVGDIRGGGGKDIEMGYALSWDIPIIIVGERRTAFHWLPDVHFVHTLEEAVDRMVELVEGGTGVAS